MVYRIHDWYPYHDREEEYFGLLLEEAVHLFDDLTGIGADTILADLEEGIDCLEHVDEETNREVTLWKEQKGMQPPKVPDETRLKARESVREALGHRTGEDTCEVCEKAADAATEAIYGKLLGDANDRVATALHAARAFLDLDPNKTPASNVRAKRNGLRKALDGLDHPAAWPAGARGSRRGDAEN